MVETLAKDYLINLEDNSYKINGFYQHGSITLGYGDEHSDIDILIVWKDKYPPKHKREDLLIKMGLEIIRISDSDMKGSDYINIKGKEYNFSHRVDISFFDKYNQALEGTINEFDIYGLGGFKNSEILFDPENKLNEFRESLVVTDELVENFNLNRKDTIINNLHDMKIASCRGHTIFFIKSLNYLLTTFHIQLYLKNKMFPITPKWIDKEASKYEWENPLIDVVKTFRDSQDLNAIYSKLESFSVQFELLK